MLLPSSSLSLSPALPSSPSPSRSAAAAHRDYIARETLATSFELGDGATLPAERRDYAGEIAVDGLKLTVSLRRVAS